MESKILEALGMDPGILIISLFVLVVILFVFVISVNMKYTRLKSSYNSFMRGKDGRTLEDSIYERFEELDHLTEATLKNRQAIRKINEEIMSNYQKLGIVKYDAFQEMGGKLSFALTLLDGNNSGYIINSMHSREGCYNYIKEIVKGESYIELSEEEAESLDRAIFQETLGL
ncbi:MAG: DUF4446 family protein [Lachnospiraceae bacterium]|jgi:hypothetical protein|nr:DUF4446 family protein [Lachnospiraceae bacterium]